MVSKLLNLLNREIKTMNQGALLLALFSIASQLLGLIRDRSLAHFFGPGETLDVYYAAFRIPDFLYNSFASVVSVTALIPFLSSYLKSHFGDERREDLRDFSQSLFTVFVGTMIIVCGSAFIFMKPLSFLVVPGFGEAQRESFIMLSRILLSSPILLGLSNLFGSFSQVQKKFYAFALAPLFYNAFILVGIYLFRPSIGITGVVLGVVLGAVLHMAIQLPTLIELKTFPRITFKPNWQFVKKVVTVSIPRTISLSLSNVTILVMGSVASLLAAGSISIFNFSYNIQTTPFYIIGISYAVAAFPVLSRFYNEQKFGEFSEIIYKAAKNIFFFSIPLSLLFIVLRAQIVRVLLGSGMFTWSDTRLVAASLALFSISIAAQSMILLLVRGFYATGNTKTPLRINLLSVIITLVLSVVFVWMYKTFSNVQYFLSSLLRLEGIQDAGVILLPLSFSIGQIINASLLWHYFKKTPVFKDTAARALGRMLFHITAAGIIGASASYFTLNLLSEGIRNNTFVGILVQGLLAGIVGTLVYVGMVKIMNHEELKDMVAIVTSRFWKQKPVAPEQPEV